MIFEEERDYATVAAGQTKATLGPKATDPGDILVSVTIIPATTGAGNVDLFDSSGGSAIRLFTSGTLSDLKPINLRLRMRSKVGPWLISTGTNVSVVATGRFK